MPYLITWRFILILSSHLRLSPFYKLFSLRSPPQIPVRLCCPIRATCPTHLLIPYSVARTASNSLPVTNSNRTVSQRALCNGPRPQIVDIQHAPLFRSAANRMCWLRSVTHWVVLLPYGWVHAWRHGCRLHCLSNCCWQHSTYTSNYGQITHT